MSYQKEHSTANEPRNRLINRRPPLVSLYTYHQEKKPHPFSTKHFHSDLQTEAGGGCGEFYTPECPLHPFFHARDHLSHILRTYPWLRNGLLLSSGIHLGRWIYVFVFGRNVGLKVRCWIVERNQRKSLCYTLRIDPKNSTELNGTGSINLHIIEICLWRCFDRKQISIDGFLYTRFNREKQFLRISHRRFQLSVSP